MVIGLIVVGAVALRLWLALGPLGRSPDSDEDVVGLMALHIVRHHEFHAFYWGQTYGGSIESILVAPFVAAFGATRLGLRSASIGLTVVMAWLTWRIACHLFDRRVASWAGALSLLWPLALVSFGTHERGFYPLSAALGLTTVLMAVNIDEDARPVRHWIGLGLAVGIGWWASPNIIYYAIPSVVWLAARGHWRQWRNVIVAGCAAVLGDVVWIAANLRSGFASMHVAQRLGGTSTYASRFGFFWRTAFPFALGLRRPHSAEWYWSPVLGRTMYAAVLIVLAYCLWKAFEARSIELPLFVFAPFVFAFFLPTWLLNEGRYTYFVASILPLLMCRILSNRWGRSFVVVLVVLTGIAFFRDYRRLQRPLAAGIGPITQVVERNGYHTVIANYWIAFRMTYESSEHVIASPLPGQAGARYQPYIAAIVASTPAYVFDAHGAAGADRTIVRKLEAAHISYRIVRAGAYYAVLPSDRLIAAP